MNELILETRGVTQRYPGTLAVDHVDFEARAGEVHALMGENGAGKSTLMKIFAGSFADYTGEIWVRGRKTDLHTPRQAKSAGIEMIHQELSLAPSLSIAENILAGRLPTKAKVFVDGASLLREARACLNLVGLDLNPMLPVETLSQHEAQLVEIAKALGNRPSILVMDEPTSALGRSEVSRLFDLIRQLRSRGLCILYISHQISEVFQIADRVTVLRDGRKVQTLALSSLTPDRVVEMMVGRTVQDLRIPRSTTPGSIRFEAKALSRFGFFHDISFQIRAHEILGIGGLAGSGRTELARSLCGLDPLDEGELLLGGKSLPPSRLQGRMKQGLGYLTEDRKALGLALKLSVQDNAVSALQAKTRRFCPDRIARKMIERFSQELEIHPPDPEMEVQHLSGGNQQKVLLAKWLAIAPEVCILDEPTRGVDVGAKQAIHEAIGRLADSGQCVLLISSDLTELAALSDRVLILRKGHQGPEMSRQDLSEDAILLAASREVEG